MTGPRPTRRRVLAALAAVGMEAGRAGAADGTGTSRSRQRDAPATDWPTHGMTPRRPGGAADRVAPRSAPNPDWAFGLDHERFHPPVVVGDTLLAAGRRGTVVALAVADGSERWRVEPFDGQSFDREFSRAVVAGDRAVLTKSTDSAATLLALSVADGSVDWRREVDTPLSPPAVDGGTVHCCAEGRILGFDAATGESTADISVGVGQSSPPPTITDTTLYAGGPLTAIARDSGTTRWQSEAVGDPVAAVGNRLYGGQGSRVVAVDPNTGGEAWGTGIGGPVTAPVAVVDGTVYAVSEDTHVYALDAESGDLRWRHRTEGSLEARPIVVGDTVYAASTDETLYALAVDDGSERWSFTLPDEHAEPAAVAGGRLFVTTPNFIYAFGPAEATGAGASSSGRAGTPSPTRTVAPGGGRDGSQPSPTAPGNQLLLAGDGRAATPELLATGGAGLAVGAAAALYRARAASNGDDGSPAGGAAGGTAPGDGSSGAADAGEAGHASGAPDATAGSEDETALDAGQGQALVGSAVAGYAVREYVGAGGSAYVYRATDDDREVALKLPRMPGRDTLDRSVLRAHVHEAETWAQVDDHPHVVTVHGWGTDPLPWLALEYLAGGSLRRRMDRSTSDALAVLEAMCEGLWHAHSDGVTHGDIKPENVLFTDESGATPKLSDWGTATRMLDDDGPGGLTPAYAAPEQAAPDQYGDPDELTDVYQVGAVAYELLAGAVPFDRPNANAILYAVSTEEPPPLANRADVPDRLASAVHTALAKDRDDRFDTVLHLRDEIRAVRNALG